MSNNEAYTHPCTRKSCDSTRMIYMHCIRKLAVNTVLMNVIITAVYQKTHGKNLAFLPNFSIIIAAYKHVNLLY